MIINVSFYIKLLSEIFVYRKSVTLSGKGIKYRLKLTLCHKKKEEKMLSFVEIFLCDGFGEFY